MKAPHTSTFNGETVFIRLRNGDKITGRFNESTGRFVFLDVAKVPIPLIKSFSIRKLRPEKQ